ncbi:MAG: M28 family peptidase, partial [Bryobacteraceae bacterium]
TGIYMRRAQALLFPLLIVFLLFDAAAAIASDFSGESALEFTKKVVYFGPRPPTSAANKNLQAYILAQMKLHGCQIIEDPFTAKTPKGPMPMRNLICKFPGKTGKAIVFTGHFDTKLFPGRKFVGANDGGSSTGLLLEMVRALSKKPRKDDVYLVFYDGEEAIGEWSPTDGIHGSRHLAERWKQEGVAGRIKALVNVDMIGDKDLGVLQEMNSTPGLRRLVWKIAADLGYSKYFLDSENAIEDDHMPFLKIGVPALDLIDFDFPAWHTDGDTIDKVSARSLMVVGDVLMELLRRIEG